MEKEGGRESRGKEGGKRKILADMEYIQFKSFGPMHAPVIIPSHNTHHPQR